MKRALLLFAATACSEPAPAEPLPSRTLGGVEIAGATLKTGERAYRAVCESCHGAAGDGKGRLGVRQNPKPRDFANGVIKFASVPAGALWTDEDVLRTLRRGLEGTQMIRIKLPDADLHAVTQYLKTFSPRWESERPGPPITVVPDPYAGSGAVGVGTAIARGGELYTERCARCHDRSVDVETIWEDPVSTPVLEGYVAKAGADPETLYRTLAAGVGGIPEKKGLADTLPPRDIWALVYHVRTLVR